MITYTEYAAKRLAAARRWNETVAQGNALAAQQTAEVEIGHGLTTRVEAGKYGHEAVLSCNGVEAERVRVNGRERRALTLEEAEAQVQTWANHERRAR